MAASDILERLLELRVIDIDKSSEVSYDTPWKCVVCEQIGNPEDSARCMGCGRINFQLHLSIQQRLSKCPPQVEEVDFSQLEVRNVDEVPRRSVWKCEICGTLDIPPHSIKCTGCGRLNFQLYAATLPPPAPPKMPILEEVKLPPPIVEPSPVPNPVSISRILDFATLPLVSCTALKSQFWDCQVCEQEDNPSDRAHCIQCNRVNFPTYTLSTDLAKERKSIAKCFEEEEKREKSDNKDGFQIPLLSQSPSPIPLTKEKLAPSEPIQAPKGGDRLGKENDSMELRADDHNARHCCCCPIY